MRTTRIHRILDKVGAIAFPGVFDTLSAKVCQRCGFPMAFVRSRFLLIAVVAGTLGGWLQTAAGQETLPGTERLDWTGDSAVRIVEEAHRFLDRKLEDSVSQREKYWKCDFSSVAALGKSVEPNRERLKKILGIVDQRIPVSMERFGDDQNPAYVAETSRYRVYQVRWPVLEGVHGEGLLLEPKGTPVGQIVAIPDADQTPEQLVGLAPGVKGESQFARRLAENGYRVVVPVLVSRECEFSGNPAIAMTNQPHREWIYRQAFEMGRHVIGYEVQKVLAVVDWFRQSEPKQRIAVAGYAEGGLLAFYAAAVDTRIDACLTSGYFQSRQRLWEEPIYRNVWGLLREFGDAELALLVSPRALVIEHSPVPAVSGPPGATPGRRASAAPGKLTTPSADAVAGEVARANSLDKGKLGVRHLVAGAGGEPIGPGSRESLAMLAKALGRESAMELSAEMPNDQRTAIDAKARQKRQVAELTNHVQHLQRTGDAVRDRFFLQKADRKSAAAFAESANRYRQILWQEVIGAIDDPLLAPAPKTRKVYDEPTWTGYEVALDVWPELHAWGILCVPKDLKPGEKRPVVVCQHGLEGIPQDTIERTARSFRAYQAFTTQLVERGFVTFAPFNLYRGVDQFRTLQRKANPLQASLFSLITRQHEQILNWLGTLPFVDRSRIALYGISYGGKTAMRVPALLEGYCLSICSADFNDWIRKNISVDAPYSYMFTHEWEIYEFNLGQTFNYAELAYLIFPRPFMVERGHHDGVAPDCWVAYEYAKVRWLYANLGQGDKTTIEFFNGPHAIHGQGTFKFLHQHLNWPRPARSP
jgi:dienelactone hydrolase